MKTQINLGTGMTEGQWSEHLWNDSVSLKRFSTSKRSHFSNDSVPAIRPTHVGPVAGTVRVQNRSSSSLLV